MDEFVPDEKVERIPYFVGGSERVIVDCRYSRKGKENNMSKVREVIEELQQYNPDAEVLFDDGEPLRDVFITHGYTEGESDEPEDASDVIVSGVF